MMISPLLATFSLGRHAATSAGRIQSTATALRSIGNTISSSAGASSRNGSLTRPLSPTLARFSSQTGRTAELLPILPNPPLPPPPETEMAPKSMWQRWSSQYSLAGVQRKILRGEMLYQAAKRQASDPYVTYQLQFCPVSCSVQRHRGGEPQWDGVSRY